MKESRKFHLGDILSVVNGQMLSVHGIKGLYDILNYMTNDSIYTHQIPRVMDECAPYLVNEMPWLENIDTSNITPDNFEKQISVFVQEYGEFHPVWQIHFDDHENISPIEEGISMFGADRVIVVDLSNDK
jgi:hypothetical protein